MLRVIFLVLAGMLPQTLWACNTALILTMDVSNSVDAGEWALQRDGLADALADREVIEAMIQAQANVMVIQWSGVDRQEISIPWTQIQTEADVANFRQRASNLTRAFILSDTAPAEAIAFALQQFAAVPDCRNKVIDVSGDGTPNAGTSTLGVRRQAERMGVTINGIAIESLGLAITNFYRRSIITRNGFVMTARMHRDYPRALREKLIRELALVFG